MGIVYFEIVETVRIKYRCDLHEEYSSVKEFADKEGIGEVFSKSSHEEILDYLDCDEETITE